MDWLDQWFSDVESSDNTTTLAGYLTIILLASNATSFEVLLTSDVPLTRPINDQSLVAERGTTLWVSLGTIVFDECQSPYQDALQFLEGFCEGQPFGKIIEDKESSCLRLVTSSWDQLQAQVPSIETSCNLYMHDCAYHTLCTGFAVSGFLPWKTLSAKWKLS